MDVYTHELVAIGAAAAANCASCLRFHLAKCDELEISREDAAEAVEVGLMVNRGAEFEIRKTARELLGEHAIAEQTSVAMPEWSQSTVARPGA